MSRSAVPKSRSEKSRAMAVPATTPQVALVEIIPGRFTETDWQTMVAAEDGENNVMDIIEDIVSQALDQCYSIYIENQLLPFTIAQAKDAILQIIEWQFLTHDPGESNVSLDHSWQEDREPKANVTDSWAQGSVPVLWPPHTPALQEQEPRGLGLCPETEDCYSAPAGHGSTCGDQQPGLQGPRDTSPLCSQLMGISQDLEQVETEPEKTSTVNEPEQAPEAITVRKKSHSLKARRCLQSTEKVRDIIKPLDQREADLTQQWASEEPLIPCEEYWVPPYLQDATKIQRGRLPSNNAVTFDEFGNIISVQRLDPSKFRRHRTKPIFRLMEPDAETGSCRLLGSQPLRPLVFPSGRFGRRPIPDRYRSRRAQQPGPGRGSGLGMLGTGPGVAQRPQQPNACPVSTSPDFPEFIPDGAKDRNHSKCGQYPEYEEPSPSRLRPICDRLLAPPIAVEQLASSIVL